MVNFFKALLLTLLTDNVVRIVITRLFLRSVMITILAVYTYTLDHTTAYSHISL